MAIILCNSLSESTSAAEAAAEVKSDRRCVFSITLFPSISDRTIAQRVVKRGNTGTVHPMVERKSIAAATSMASMADDARSVTK